LCANPFKFKYKKGGNNGWREGRGFEVFFPSLNSISLPRGNSLPKMEVRLDGSKQKIKQEEGFM
jgi:hypothetical protein